MQCNPYFLHSLLNKCVYLSVHKIHKISVWFWMLKRQWRDSSLAIKGSTSLNTLKKNGGKNRHQGHIEVCFEYGNMVIRWLLESALWAQRWPGIRGMAAGEGGGRVFSPAKTLWGSGNTLKNDVQRNAPIHPHPPPPPPQFSSQFWWLKSVTLSPPTQTLLLTIKPLCKLSFWIGVHRGGWNLLLSIGWDKVITLCSESTHS